MTGRIAAQSNRTASSDDVLPALLMEVRGLRAAMEQMASAGPRVQLSIGRLQLQEQRINTMLRRVESVADSVSGAESRAAAIQERARNAEQRLTRATNVTADEREQLELMIPELKREAARAAAEAQRIHAEKAQLEQQIATEQGRWSDINSALEELERALGRR
jgi:predicted  nucleic acid-binding Zn-ribbon protein